MTSPFTNSWLRHWQAEGESGGVRTPWLDTARISESVTPGLIASQPGPVAREFSAQAPTLVSSKKIFAIGRPLCEGR